MNSLIFIIITIAVRYIEWAFLLINMHIRSSCGLLAVHGYSSRVIARPLSQEILSLGNIVAATIFPKEIVSL